MFSEDIALLYMQISLCLESHWGMIFIFVWWISLVQNVT